MKLLSVEFVTTLAPTRGRPGEGRGPAELEGVPRDGIPQVAFAGRSNVGKSSLLNALCRRTIARTSAAPGKTRLVNVYRAALEGGPGGPGRWQVYLVDLPGYGYARGSRDSVEELRAAAEAYFRTVTSTSDARRPDVRAATMLLVDSRHPGLDADIAAAEWLNGLGITWRPVATKIDKLSRAERARNLGHLERTLGMAALPVSAASGEGLEELWQMIANLVRR